LTVRAEYLEDGAIAVIGTKGKQTFNKVWAGIGWPDNEAGYISIVGERADHRYHALWEKTGGLWELGVAAVEAKNRLLVDNIWVDSRDAVATSYLRTVPGLCFHEEPPKRALTTVVGTHPPAKASRFTELETTASVMSVPERVTTNYRSALENTRGVIMASKLLIHEQNCPKLVYALRQPLEDLLRSPVMKALVWVLTALEEAGRNAGLELSASDPWYANTPRRRI
jgi:hypothetical protein